MCRVPTAGGPGNTTRMGVRATSGAQVSLCRTLPQITCRQPVNPVLILWIRHSCSYSPDLMVLRSRAGPSSAYQFHQVRQHVEAAADRVACVVGGPGEGKSTLAAMMLESGGDATGFIHASHFCKRADTNRQVMFGALVHPPSAHPFACVQWLRAPRIHGTQSSDFRFK